MISNRGRIAIAFILNSVTADDGKGGAIFAPDDNYCKVASHPCLVDYYDDIHLIFSNNSAKYGSTLYGGLLDRCSLSKPGIDYFEQISEYQPQTPLAITSDPSKVCLCSSSNQICTTREIWVSKMRGESVFVNINAVDQTEYPLISIIKANFKTLSAQLDKGEGRKEVNGNCSELSYRVFTTSTFATLELHPDGPCDRSPLSSITIHISVLPCSKEFEQKIDRCVCDRRLINSLDVTIYDIDTQSVKKKGNLWLKYDEENLKASKNCPYDYCQLSSDSISLLYPDEQCANHRSGVLCGACQDNYSIALGGTKCLPCTSRYTSVWLTTVFAVAELALVALLLVCNMTISRGTLNGVIFYANVFSISGLANTQNCSIHPIPSVFIAWVNLDFGIETCFYSGLDTFQKTWLQFAFPLYIWLLVATIIVASYYSSRAMRIFGRNNVAILATLLLLSYSKILKIIITALSFTQVLVSSADDVNNQLLPYRVWTYDGNINYLKGKHVALFTMGLLLLVFLFLPYTLLLIFGQCVRSLPVRRRWMQRLIRSTTFISIMDAYHAPYKKKHRYWTGLMLLTRCVLFLTFASSYGDGGSLQNMYITTLVIFGILVIKTYTNRIYKANYLDTLELFFLINIGALSATLYYLKGSNSSYNVACKCKNASSTISFVIFLGVLTHHTHLRLQKLTCYSSIKQSLLNKLPFRLSRTNVVGEIKAQVNTGNNNKQPTETLIELREELLASS